MTASTISTYGGAIDRNITSALAKIKLVDRPTDVSFPDAGKKPPASE